jgi:hypothetical protein
MATGPLALDIRAIFAQEVTALDGAVSDVFEEGPLLMARSVLPWVEEVRPGDRVRGGVAIRSDGEDVFVHPYTFRQVCSNGAILATTIETRHVELPADEEAIREAIRACGAREAFAEVAGRMRTALETQADLALNLMPMLRRFPGAQGAQLMRQIMEQFLRERDRSTFGLFNAVTATARDTRDPHLRWRLEEFGGGLLVATPDAPVFDDSAAAVYATV